MPDTEHIVVIGAMGSGKTTIGERLAEALGRVFHDSDRSIEGRTGRSGREIAETGGVDVLHRLEKEVLLDSLSAEQPAVIAAAASVIEDPDVRDDLLGAFRVWVTADPRILAERSARGSHRRPVLQSEHLENRDRLFKEMADVMVDTGDRSIEESVAVVLEALRDPDR
ncbi:MAG: shikimate kinase [Acidimicrobiia bacterium]